MKHEGGLDHRRLPFSRRPQDRVKDLSREAALGALADAGLDDGGLRESVRFGNCGTWTENQGRLRGLVCLTPLTREGRLPGRIPLTNVEGGCAIEIAEVRDATAFCEIFQVEMSGFCPRGSGGACVESGATTLGTDPASRSLI